MRGMQGDVPGNRMMSMVTQPAAFVRLLFVVAASLALLSASAGWAGSVYKRSECTYDATSNLLFCYTENLAITEPSTRNVSIEDASCESGYRLVERSGRFTQT